MEEYKLEWKNCGIDNRNLIKKLDIPIPGQYLSRQEWVTLNRLCTGHGHKWKIKDCPDCDSGHYITVYIPDNKCLPSLRL